MKQKKKKNKKKGISPTQRSLKLLRELGWTCAITEHWNPFAFIRQDLFGFVDILAIKDKMMLAVQTTTNENATAREKKIIANENYKVLKSTGCQIEIHGWHKSIIGSWCVRIIGL
jgi:hypothetical protein